MKIASRPLLQQFLLSALLIASLFWPSSLQAQATTGTVTGRVYNPATQAYVGNAEVRLEGTKLVTYTNNDGSFQFNGVAAGPATVSVIYTGYETVKESFTVSGSETAVREINLTSTAASSSSKENKDGTPLVLETFNVVSALEGNAKAVMSQRKNMDIVTAVSADSFGDVLSGNVGEFLKYLPGVDLDYVESETRGPRLGGMDGQYVGVAFDGMRTANADANRGGGAASRGTSFEGFSITAIDSIEVHRTASPEDDADAPAGVINLKTKRAFDRKGLRLDYNLGATLNSDEFTLKQKYHPAEKLQHQFRPSGGFTFADSFFDQKFGILLSGSRSQTMTEQTSESTSYDTSPTAADPRSMIVYKVDFKDAPKWITKDSLLLTSDWKVFQHLTLSLNLQYSLYNSDNLSRDLVFQAANNNSNANNGRSTIGGDGLRTFVGTNSDTNTVSGLNWGGGSANKKTWTRNYIPRFEYKFGPLTVDGAVAYSKSLNIYDAIGSDFTNSTTGGVPASFTATRPDKAAWQWTIRQTSGNDWFNINSFGQPTTGVSNNLGGTSAQDRTEKWKDEKWTEVLNATYVLPFLRNFPTTVKIGGKVDDEDRVNHNQNSLAQRYVYIGPGGDTVTQNPVTGVYTIATIGNWGNLGPQYISPDPFLNYNTNRLNLTNINGVGGIAPFPNQSAIAALYRSHPELWVSTASVNDYYNAVFAPERRFSQRITSGYGQADTRVTSKLTLRYGVRMENTETWVKEFSPLTPIQMLNSPFASQFTQNPVTGVVAPQLATTIAGLNYQFLTNPKVTRYSSYHDYFPSVVAKYDILANLEWQFGWNKAISRPAIDNLTNTQTINDNATPPTVSIANPNLKPEHHEVYQTRLAYYFGGRSPGQLSVAVIQDEATNFISSKTYPDGSALGNTDPQFAGYQFISFQNDPGVHRYRNYDFNYQQTLGFLPSPYLRGLSLGIIYSRSYDNQRHVNLVPEKWKFTPSYTYKRFSAGVGVVWDQWKPNSSTYGEYFGAVTRIDINNVSYRINNHLSLYMAVHNITNAKDLQYKSLPGAPEGQQGAVRGMEVYGSFYTFGVKGTF